MKETRIGFITLALMLAIWASACGSECTGFGSCIEIGEEPEPPTCAELVADECVDEVIAEFCPPPRVIVVPPEPVDCDDCDEAYKQGVRDGIEYAKTEGYGCPGYSEGRGKDQPR